MKPSHKRQKRTGVRRNGGIQCEMCTRKIRGKPYHWGVKRLCLACYRTHCDGYTTLKNFRKKLLSQRMAPVKQSSSPRPGFWQRLLGL
jgi:ribosome-binding protein aMBF1 (putative translation factor)